MSEFITKKLAIFKMPGSYNEGTECGEWAEGQPGYARLTEYSIVQFTRLPPSIAIENQLATLSAAETELRSKFQEELDRIESERGKLLAITHNG